MGSTQMDDDRRYSGRWGKQLVMLGRSLVDRSVQRVGLNERALHGIGPESHNRWRLRSKVETVLACSGAARSNNRLPSVCND